MAKKQPDLGDLCQRWIHSHEEDTETESIYRPAGFPLPPARGRAGIELNPDKSCRSVGIAAGDGSRVSEGTWEFEDGMTLLIRIRCGDEDSVLNIRSVESDRLVIRRKS